MPRKKDPKTEIEFERLRYEYLNRSEPFKKFCALSDKCKLSFREKKGDKVTKANLWNMFTYYGNPFNKNFEQWYSEQTPKIKDAQNYKNNVSVKTVNFHNIHNLACYEIKRMGLDSLSPDKKQKIIGMQMQGMLKHRYLFLQIDLTSNFDEVVVPRVRELFQQKATGKVLIPITHPVLPPARKLNNELEKYLYAFDLKNNKGKHPIDITLEVLKKFPCRQKKKTC